jgi:hypothetical protein
MYGERSHAVTLMIYVCTVFPEWDLVHNLKFDEQLGATDALFLRNNYLSMLSKVCNAFGLMSACTWK